MQSGTMVLDDFFMPILSYRFHRNIDANVSFKCGGGYISHLSILFCFMQLLFNFQLSSNPRETKRRVGDNPHNFYSLNSI